VVRVRGSQGVPTLFENKVRTRRHHLKRGERLYDFYDQCALDGYDEVRTFLNRWITETSEPERSSLIARMKSGGDLGFKAGTCELIMYALLRKLGCDVTWHPVLADTGRHPDFYAFSKEGSVFVEVTTTNPPDREASTTNREAPIYNAINRARLPPGCVLGYSLIHAGDLSPSTTSLVSDVEQWARDSAQTNTTTTQLRIFEIGDWQIELELCRTNSEGVYSNAIGITSIGAQWVAAEADFRNALIGKAKKYGGLHAPYLIAVADAKGQLYGQDSVRDAVTEAVLGDEVIQFRKGKSPRVARKGNGFWFDRAPANTHVSGVILFPDTQLWGVRAPELQPVLAFNPWAQFVLPGFFRAFPHFEADKSRWKFVEGSKLGDLLDFPNPWPPDAHLR
jgi:hypothetical protein